MIFGVNTTPTAVFDAIEARIAAALELDVNYVILSMWDRDWIKNDPPVDVFVVVRPKNFPHIVGITSGMSPESKAYDGQIQIDIWTRVTLDTWNWDKNYLKDETLGAFTRLTALLQSGTGLEQYTPLNDDDECILKEPMRNVGFAVIPKDPKKAWGIIETNWSVQFCYGVK